MQRGGGSPSGQEEQRKNLMDRFIGTAAQGRPGNRTPSPRPGDTAEPRVQVQRVPEGWVDEAAGTLKLKGVSVAQGGIVRVEKPPLEYFLRGGRKRAPSKLPGVFECELMKVIIPHVAWKEKGKEGGADRRSTPAAGMSYDDGLRNDVLAMRWVRGSGRASNVLDDPDLSIWISNISNDTYRPPSRKFAGASGELAQLDFLRMTEAIDDNIEQDWLFYRGLRLGEGRGDRARGRGRGRERGEETVPRRPWGRK